MKWPHRTLANFGQIVAEPPKQDNREAVLRLVTALILLGSALIGIANKFATLAIAAVGIVVIVFLAPMASRTTKRLCLGVKRRQFVHRQRVGLDELVRRFPPFVEQNRSTSIVCIVHSLCSNHSDAIDRILPSNYASAWLTAFQQQLAFPTQDIHCFMTRCEEFISFVYHFNLDYVLRAQKAIERGEQLKEHDIDQLERFREEFNDYLRSVEKWLDKLSKDWSALGHNGQLFGLPFASHFERLKSFGRSAVAKAN